MAGMICNPQKIETGFSGLFACPLPIDSQSGFMRYAASRETSPSEPRVGYARRRSSSAVEAHHLDNLVFQLPERFIEAARVLLDLDGTPISVPCLG